MKSPLSLMSCGVVIIGMCCLAAVAQASEDTVDGSVDTLRTAVIDFPPFQWVDRFRRQRKLVPFFQKSSG